MTTATWLRRCATPCSSTKSWSARRSPKSSATPERRGSHCRSESDVGVRREAVHEWDLGDDGPEQVRAHVGDRAHEQTAGASAPDDESIRAGPSLSHQVPGAGDEVGEGVLLVEELALVVPAPAQLAAAADV